MGGSGGENPGQHAAVIKNCWEYGLMEVQGVLDEVDSEVLENVASFVKSTSPEM